MILGSLVSLETEIRLFNHEHGFEKFVLKLAVSCSQGRYQHCFKNFIVMSVFDAWMLLICVQYIKLFILSDFILWILGDVVTTLIVLKDMEVI